MTCSSVSFNMLQPNHGVLEMQGKIHGKSVKKKHGISQQSPRNRSWRWGRQAEDARVLQWCGRSAQIMVQWFRVSTPSRGKPPWKTHGKTHGISWVKSMDSLRCSPKPSEIRLQIRLVVWKGWGTAEDVLVPKKQCQRKVETPEKQFPDDNVEGIVRYRWFIFKQWSATPLLCKDVIFGPRASV